MRTTAFADPESHFHHYSALNDTKAVAAAREIWQGAKKSGKEVGQEAKKAGQAVGGAAKEGAQELKRAFKGEK